MQSIAKAANLRRTQSRHSKGKNNRCQRPHERSRTVSGQHPEEWEEQASRIRNREPELHHSRVAPRQLCDLRSRVILLWRVRWQADKSSGYIYTDRPIYRPNHKVFFKGILRAFDDKSRYQALKERAGSRNDQRFERREDL